MSHDVWMCVLSACLFGLCVCLSVCLRSCVRKRVGMAYEQCFGERASEQMHARVRACVRARAPLLLLCFCRLRHPSYGARGWKIGQQQLRLILLGGGRHSSKRCGKALFRAADAAAAADLSVDMSMVAFSFVLFCIFSGVLVLFLQAVVFFALHAKSLLLLYEKVSAGNFISGIISA